MGYFQLSRFKFVDGLEPAHDLASEQKIMRVEVDRGACCHVAGDIDFDKAGNLWLVTGDDTPAPRSASNNTRRRTKTRQRERQTVTVAGATGRTFTLSFGGQTTAPIAFPLMNADIEAALEALTNIDEVLVGGTGTRTVKFRGGPERRGRAGDDRRRFGLTSDTTATVTIATTLQGGALIPGAVQRCPPRLDPTPTTSAGKILRDQGQSGDNPPPPPPLRHLLGPVGRRVPKESEDLDDKTRPEIYAMGFRNPFRIQVDENGVAYVADYSPDSKTPHHGQPCGGRNGADRDRPQARQLRLADVLQDRPARCSSGTTTPRTDAYGRGRMSATTRTTAPQNASQMEHRPAVPGAADHPTRTSGARSATT